MLKYIQPENVLVVDIETVPVAADFESLPPEYQALWVDKAGRKGLAEKYHSMAECWFNNAGIFAEFGKIICVSAGYFHKKSEGGYEFRISSFANRDEKTLLQAFADTLNNYFNDTSRYYMCGHNIQEFDVPYLCRRMLVNGLELPALLDIAGKKPWEVKQLDTLQLWKFGDFKAYTSLKLLAHIFGIPTPKDDIDGSDVGRVFWYDDDLERIVTYCQKDVLTTARLLMRYKGMPTIDDEQVTIIERQA